MAILHGNALLPTSTSSFTHFYGSQTQFTDYLSYNFPKYTQYKQFLASYHG